MARTLEVEVEIDQGSIDALIRNPSESLNVEIKRWIDPATDEGKAKLVRGCFALRNRNGGYFIVGFDDRTLQPDLGHEPLDPRSCFHVDIVQGLLSKYAPEPFEVAVAFSLRNGIDYPVIVVPSGVQVPVASKKDLIVERSTCVKLGDVYFRTLNSNGRPSTSVARPHDWRDIIDICFENREADIGGFIRRQLYGLDAAKLKKIFNEIGFVGSEEVAEPAVSLRELTINLIDAGKGRFDSAIQERTLASRGQDMIDLLTWHVGLVVEPALSDRIADATFLAEVFNSNPHYTGWPIWLDPRSFNDQSSRPRRVNDAWEYLIISDAGWSSHLEFARFEPSGRFYLRRTLQDDLSGEVSVGAYLDPILVILRVAEAVAVGLAAVRALAELTPASRSVGFAFRWVGLRGRALYPWAHPQMLVIGEHTSHENEITSYIELPSDIAINSISPFIEQATRELFALFNGQRVPLNVIENWVARLLERRL